MKKEYIFPEIQVVATSDIRLLSGSPEPMAEEASEYYTVLSPMLDLMDQGE